MFLLKTLFWGSVIALGYTYVGYPLLLGALAKVRPRPWARAELTPSLAIVIAAWNEAGVIEAKLQNAIGLDYPKDRLHIVVASDGSSDDTVAIARRFESQGVMVLDLPRGGKTSTLNRAMEILTAKGLQPEVLVFSDANVFFEPDALKQLVRHFADPTIGGVSGDVRLKPDGFSLAQSQGLYYRYERFIQEKESLIGSIIGADGGMYAMRGRLFKAIPPHLINDDFILSMEVVRQGMRLIYDPEAIAYEDSPVDSANEFRRKVRVEQGNFQALFSGWSIPGKDQPIERFCYFSHKVARWCGFVPLSIALGSSAALAPLGGLPLLALGLQSTLYVLALVGAFKKDHGGSATNVPYYFVMENFAAVKGFYRLMTGQVQWGTAATRTRNA